MTRMVAGEVILHWDNMLIGTLILLGPYLFLLVIVVLALRIASGIRDTTRATVFILMTIAVAVCLCVSWYRAVAVAPPGSSTTWLDNHFPVSTEVEDEVVPTGGEGVRTF